MGKLSRQFFSADEKEAIRRSIAAVERETAGEIVVMVVDASDEYREAAVAGGVVVAASAAFALSLLLHHETIWFYIPLAFLLWWPGYLIFRKSPRLTIALVHRARSRRAVRERAVRSFFEKELHRTRDASGILIFLSVLEKKVWILGDRGIHERVDGSGWTVYADRITAGIRQGTAGAVVCEVIEDCGKILKDAFPPRPDDRNELPDHVIT